MDETYDLEPSNAIDFQDFSTLPWDSDSVYVTELIKGKRCMAKYNELEGRWRFFTWHMVELIPAISMGSMDKRYVYDGFISTTDAFEASKALAQYVVGDTSERPSYDVSKDLGATAYIITDVFGDPEMSELSYRDRHIALLRMVNSQLDFKGAEGVYLIPMIERVPISENVFENPMLTITNLFNKVQTEGGEGIVLYFDKATYQHGKTHGVQVLRGIKTASLLIEKVFYKKDEDGSYIDSFLCHGMIGDTEVMTHVKAYTMRKKSRRKYAQGNQALCGKICEITYNNFEAQDIESGTYSLRNPRVLFVRYGDDDNKSIIY